MINVAEEMERLHTLARRTQDQIRKPLWKLLTDKMWLAQAWEQIRNNKGSQTPGIDKMTAIDIDLELIHKLADSLKNGTYRPTPVRRVFIPKANGKTRPLGISTIKDRIVQQAIRMLLEPIFEADFCKCSHGFRQGRSTITALRDVSHAYPVISYLIEGDIEGCFDNIPHGGLLELIKKRVADEKVLSLISKFLKAGYLEEWRYHRTYSGIPQGNIVGPLLCNVFLHQLDLFMMRELNANQSQSPQQANARRNPEYRKFETQITKRRRQLRDGRGDRATVKEIKELERQRKYVPCYAGNKKHPGKVWYVRYCDDFLVLVAGTKKETEAIKEQIRLKLSDMGLKLSEKKTKITHWSESFNFLGYQIQGKLRRRGVGLRAVFSVPHQSLRQLRKDLEEVSGYYHIPEVDLMKQFNAQYRGWCNYYRYATSPQKVFSKMASFIWWQYAHFNARKHKSSIKAMLMKERKAGRYGTVHKIGRKRETFQIKLEKKTLFLDLFPPRKQQIKAVPTKQDWKADLKPVTPMNWQSGRSYATRLLALDRANGVCEKCGENPVTHVHHKVPIRKKTFLARIMSDRDQRYTAEALCQKCHLDRHGGSYCPGIKRIELER
jgi:group II intron reverse transcriptase/maturase